MPRMWSEFSDTNNTNNNLAANLTLLGVNDLWIHLVKRRCSLTTKLKIYRFIFTLGNSENVRPTYDF